MNPAGAQFVNFPVMSEKRNKYDTDPLDPDFVRQTDEMWGATRGVEPRSTDGMPGNEQETIRLPGTPQPAPSSEPPRAASPTDAPTRRMDEQFSQSYPSIFIPPTYQQSPPPVQYQQPPPAAPYQQPPPNAYQQPYAPPAPAFATRERTVAGVNISEKWTTMLPYAPFYIGLVASLIELLLVPRHEVRARFHASQGLALQLTIMALSYLFTFIGFITHSNFGGGLVWAAGFVFMIISMIRVSKGEEHRIGPLADATKWLNERISPRKS